MDDVARHGEVTDVAKFGVGFPLDDELVVDLVVIAFLDALNRLHS